MYDAVIRFESGHPAIRRRRRRCGPEFDSGDHLHPNEAGYKAMGESVDLALFSRGLITRGPDKVRAARD